MSRGIGISALSKMLAASGIARRAGQHPMLMVPEFWTAVGVSLTAIDSLNPFGWTSSANSSWHIIVVLSATVSVFISLKLVIYRSSRVDVCTIDRRSARQKRRSPGFLREMMRQKGSIATVWCYALSAVIVVGPMSLAGYGFVATLHGKDQGLLDPQSSGASAIFFYLLVIAWAGFTLFGAQLGWRAISRQPKELPMLLQLMRIEALVIGIGFAGISLFVVPSFEKLPLRHVVAISAYMLSLFGMIEIVKTRRQMLKGWRIPTLVERVCGVRKSRSRERQAPQLAPWVGAVGPVAKVVVVVSFAAGTAGATGIDGATMIRLLGRSEPPTKAASPVPSTTSSAPRETRSSGALGRSVAAGRSTTPTVGVGGSQSSLIVDFDQVCGNAISSLPGFGAPTKEVRDKLYALWLGTPNGTRQANAGTAAAPGAKIAGCPQPIRSVTDDNATVYYQVGMEGSEVKSVGAVSARYGAAMVLRDGGAATHVVDELRAGIAVGISPRERVMAGDVLLTYDDSGSTLFVRAVLHPTGRQQTSQPYVVLPPAATTAWLYLATEAHEFLWPSTPEPSGNDLVVRLSASPYGATLATITYEPDGNLATVTVNGISSMFHAVGRTIPITEVSSLPAD